MIRREIVRGREKNVNVECLQYEFSDTLTLVTCFHMVFKISPLNIIGKVVDEDPVLWTAPHLLGSIWHCVGRVLLLSLLHHPV